MRKLQKRNAEFTHEFVSFKIREFLRKGGKIKHYPTRWALGAIKYSMELDILEDFEHWGTNEE